MKLAKYFVAIIFLGFSYTSTAKVYQWVDANGVTQFSQTPPNSKRQIKVKEIKQNKKRQSQIDKNGNVCNILNVEQFSNELFLLGHLRKYLASFKQRHKEALSNYKEELKKPQVFGRRNLDYFKSTAKDYKCLYKWVENKIVEMEPIRLKYLKELNAAKEKFDHAVKEKRELGNRSYLIRNSHFSEYRNEYYRLRRMRHGLEQTLKELENYAL